MSLKKFFLLIRIPNLMKKLLIEVKQPTQCNVRGIGWSLEH